VDSSCSSLSVLHRVAALRVEVFFHLFEDSLPPLGHIIGVVDSLVRQLQQLDSSKLHFRIGCVPMYVLMYIQAYIREFQWKS